VSSLCYLIKALHQFGFAISAWLSLPDLYQKFFVTYPLTNGIAEYAGPICLVIFSSRVRSRLMLRKHGLKPGTVGDVSTRSS
ncbi:hypothetical protein PMAYCL1PPCAC_10374, partial [Pristionchus mayeri]